MMLARARLAWRYVLGVSGLRRGDVLFAVFPKSGSSWFRLILWNVINLQELDVQDADYRTLDEMPALGLSNLLRPWPYTSLPRIVKTHHPYHPLFFARPQRTILLVRDPRDVMVSYFHMAQAMKDHRYHYQGSFSDFIHHPRMGLEAWMKHYVSWSRRATVTVRYEQLRAQTAAQMARVLIALAVDVPSPVLHKAVQNTEFKRMQAREQQVGLGSDQFEAGFQFHRAGTAGQWPDYFSPDDLHFYQALLDRYEVGDYRP